MLDTIDFEPQRKKYESTIKKYFQYFVICIVFMFIFALSNTQCIELKNFKVRPYWLVVMHDEHR